MILPKVGLMEGKLMTLATEKRKKRKRKENETRIERININEL